MILNLGVFAASVGGDFEVRAPGPTHSSPVGVVQVDGQQRRRPTPPPSTLDGWHGLGDFFGVAFRDGDGAVISRGDISASAPMGPTTANGSATGVEPRYPGLPFWGLPFQWGMGRGIHDGWAVSALGFSSGGRPARILVPEPAVLLGVRITDRFKDLLDVGPGGRQRGFMMLKVGDIALEAHSGRWARRRGGQVERAHRHRPRTQVRCPTWPRFRPGTSPCAATGTDGGARFRGDRSLVRGTWPPTSRASGARASP